MGEGNSYEQERKEEARAGKKIQIEVLGWPDSFEMREEKGEFGRMIFGLK